MTDARFIALLEFTVLLVMVIGAGLLAGISIHKDDASGAAAWSAIFMAIIGVIKERQQSKTIDRMGQSLANAPPADPAAQPIAEDQK